MMSLKDLVDYTPAQRIRVRQLPAYPRVHLCTLEPHWSGFWGLSLGDRLRIPAGGVARER